MPELRHAFEPEEIMTYLDGELPAERATEAMTHLERCTECQRIVSDLGRVSRELATWQIEAPRAMTAPELTPAPATSWLARFRMPRIAFAAAMACAALAVFVFVGPNFQKRTAEFDAVLMRRPVSQPEPEPAPPMARSANSSIPQDAVSSKTEAANPTGPMIERTASLELIAADFDPLRTRLDGILANHHGYLADLTVSTPQISGRSLNATLRVPAADLDATLADLRQLGRVQSESQKGEDVTRAYADLVARLSNARNEEQRLTQILALRTGRLSDVLEVERELSRVRGGIEQMDAERRTTADQVTYATINFTASQEFHAQLGGGRESTWTRLRNAGVEGWENLTEGLLAVATFAIRYGPSIALWLGMIFLAVTLIRRWHRA